MRARTVVSVLAGTGLAAALAAPASPLRRARPAASFAAPEVHLTQAQVAVEQDTVATLIRSRLAGGDVASLALVRAFYGRRADAPAWTTTAGVRAEAAALVEVLRGVEAEGLRPEAYGLPAIEAQLALLRRRDAAGEPLDARGRTDLDVRLTDAFLTVGSHLAHGRVDPRLIHAGWSLPERRVDLVAALEDALRTGRVGAALAAAAPGDAAYVAVRAALARYRVIRSRGGWGVLEGPGSLRSGDAGIGVEALRRRLEAELPLPPAASPEVFDPGLESVVRRFQRSHGLEEDGVVGPATRAALNVSPADRIEQLELTLERLRWLPQDLGRRHVRVSIPAFELALVEDGRTTLAMRIIGGRPDWRTPIFSARMSSVVLSPYWNIPTSIALQEVVPDARRDPGSLVRDEIRVLSRGRTVSPWNVDWSRFDPSRYSLRQDPGPKNPLGGVKFLFPNRYNVYLHDTPARELFSRPVRAFSHGCMRVEKPLELAEEFLAPLGWSRAEIEAAIAARVERTIALPEAVPVHVLYQTAWVDPAGEVQFREDLYGHDRRLRDALRARGEVVTERVGECEATAGSLG